MQVCPCLRKCPDTTGDLDPTIAAMRGDLFEHDRAGFQRCVERDFAGRGLEKVDAFGKSGGTGSTDALRGMQKAGFEDQLEGCSGSTTFPSGTNKTLRRQTVGRRVEVPGQHQIDLVGAGR